MRWVLPLLLGLLLWGCGGGSDTDTKVPWAASLDAAREQAIASNSLVMMMFYADW